VLWEAAPRGVRVLYDFRNDCYPPEVARAQLALESGRAGVEALNEQLDRLDVDHVLSLEAMPLHAALAGSAGWLRGTRIDGWTLWSRLPGR
jgi:hypothetical protein